MTAMKIICAPDKFKESLTAPQAAAAMARGIAQVLPDAVVDLCPIADGGEGTVEALLAATQGQAFTTQVSDALGRPVNAVWGMLGQQDESEPTAVIEMAAASGMAIIPASDRNPMRTSTWGTGQLIKAAIEKGARRIIMGIGGSATHDGGCGALQALGATFYDHQDKAITTPIAGGDLASIKRIDLTTLSKAVRDCQFIVACDVNNPLTGPKGAAHVYSPQKGATPQQVLELDKGMASLAKVWRDGLGKDVEHTPGSGAAGGLGGGMLAMLDTKLENGAQLVLDVVHFKKRATGASLCLTGEGRLDGQSLSGKACLKVASLAAEAGVGDTIALVGSATDDAAATLEHGLRAYHIIGQGLSVAESIARAEQLLEAAAARVVKEWHEARKLARNV